jgi:acetylglutamate kinase
MSLFVIKLGGASLQNLKTLESVASMVNLIKKSGKRVVIIHGGGPAINDELTKRGITWEFIQGQRHTTPEMMEVIEEVLASKLQKVILTELKNKNLEVKGLSGAKDKILFCTKSQKDLGLVGMIEHINTSAIINILESSPDVVPVIAPIGLGFSGERFNINADWAAAKIAVALKAEKLIFLTDQNGILDARGELIEAANEDLIQELIQSGVIYGGMFTKVSTMMSAVREGVSEVLVMNALEAHSFGTQPLGTRLVDNYSSR